MGLDVANVFPAAHSGGTQKRVALARATATSPGIVFLDERKTSIDPIVSSTHRNLIARCVQNLGAAPLTLTHDIGKLRHIGDMVGMLHTSKVVWTGTVAQMDQTDNQMVYGVMPGISKDHSPQ